ncbi:SDR family oxidoreductase [Catenulispora pinisilvae]|uniref:SDR family oxidoreductase n=1 Tax=Catenulispora pinisilvae TaxID=2705253 RepID=UPI0018916994|nr:SDR family oxidoreductase [Catenulispora pinisilvae]
MTIPLIPSLSGRTAIVTGASRGIGLAIAQTLAAGGANVVLTSRTRENAEEAAKLVEGPGTAIGYQAHATDEEAARACVAFAIERFGALDILVNNAGTNPAYGPLIDIEKSRFAKTLDTNLWGPILWTSLAVKAWMGEHGGSVVNTASIGGIHVAQNLGVYNASKAALIHVTKQLALELAPKVRVNGVAPAVVRTRLAESLFADHEAEVAGAYPLGRLGEPDDVASAVAFLASDAAAWITGETLVIDGGALLGQAGV